MMGNMRTWLYGVAIIAATMSGCQEDGTDPVDPKPTADAGGSGGTGGSGGSGGTMGDMGPAGGTGGGSMEDDMGPMGGSGGATGETACEMACGSLADCAAGEEFCPGIDADGRDGLYESCLETCAMTPVLATVVNGKDNCADVVSFVEGSSEDFAAACAGEPASECAGGTVLDLNADGTETDGVWTITGMTGDADLDRGSCGGMEAGSEGFIKFVAPESSLWVFDTVAESELDTLLYARSDCADGFSEHICNDDIGGGNVKSEISLELMEGEVVYLIVDNFSGLEPTEFTLSARAVAATPPVLEVPIAAYNPDTGVLGIRIAGTDAESDVVSFDLKLFDGANMELGGQDAIPFEGFDFTQADGMFEGELILNVGQGDIAGIRITVVDRFGLKSEPHDVMAGAPAQDLARDDECEFGEPFSLCPEADACFLPEDAADEDHPICVEATAPEITGGSAYLNAESGLLGLRVQGTDAENNATGISILPKDAAGGDLSLITDEDGGGAGNGTFISVNAADGMFEGDLAVSFSNWCLPAAQEAFQGCVDAGGDQDVCVESATAGLEMCAIERAGLVASVVVAGLDSTGKTGADYAIEMVALTPTVEAGADCDLAEAFAVCPEDTLCFNVAAADVSPICQAPSQECAADWTVVDLNANGEGPWVYEGGSTDAVNLAGPGRCGGGGPQAAHSFTAAAAGVYHFEISGTAEGSDTLIFARSHCPLPQEEYELACNDDIAQGNLLSGFDLELEADQSIFVFVDGYTGQGSAGFAGAYTLTVTAP